MKPLTIILISLGILISFFVIFGMWVGVSVDFFFQSDIAPLVLLCVFAILDLWGGFVLFILILNKLKVFRPLKYGLIFGIYSIGAPLIMLVIHLINLSSDDIFIPLMIPFLPIVYFSAFLTSKPAQFYSHNLVIQDIIMIILNLLIFFLVGFLIGFLIDKIKKRKKEKQTKGNDWLKILLVTLFISIFSLFLILLNTLIKTESIEGLPEFNEILLIGLVLFVIASIVGFLIALLIFKVRNPLGVGVIIGFITPIILYFLAQFSSEHYIQIIMLYTGPLSSWESLIIAMYTAPFFYAVFGAFLGALYFFIKTLIKKDKRMIYLIITLVIILLLILFIKPPVIEVSHSINDWFVNPVVTKHYIKIERNIILNPFVSLNELKIVREGEVIYNQDISNESGSYRSYIQLTPVKVEIDPFKIFNNSFEVGKKQTCTIIVSYNRFGVEYTESVDFSLEMIERTEYPVVATK